MVQHSFTSTETRRLVRTDGRTAQDGHLDSHTASELCYNTHGGPLFYIVSPTEPTQHWSPPGEISVGADTKPCTDVAVTHPAGQGPRSIMLNLRVSRASALALREPDSLLFGLRNIHYQLRVTSIDGTTGAAPEAQLWSTEATSLIQHTGELISARKTSHAQRPGSVAYGNSHLTRQSIQGT